MYRGETLDLRPDIAAPSLRPLSRFPLCQPARRQRPFKQVSHTFSSPYCIETTYPIIRLPPRAFVCITCITYDTWAEISRNPKSSRAWRCRPVLQSTHRSSPCVTPDTECVVGKRLLWRRDLGRAGTWSPDMLFERFPANLPFTHSLTCRQRKVCNAQDRIDNTAGEDDD